MLRLCNIEKTYGEDTLKVKALKGVSLNFRKNEFVSILGASGCGKTTLLNIIGGLDRYTSGDLFICGVSTKDYNSGDWDTYRNNTIGFVFQSYNLIPHLTVLGNVEIALTISGYSKKQKTAMAKEALGKVGLSEQINKRPNQLSGGQMQRVAIARALVNNPKILLADEPTGALDSETSLQVMDILKEVANDRLVIMVTHNPELAEKYSTRIIRLFDGQVTDDSMPLSEDEEKAEVEQYVSEQTEAQKTELLNADADTKHKQKRFIKNRKKQSSMGVFAAFSLSAKNLIMKKGRTFMTAFAGSIGIIGIALILAFSNGLSVFINSIQEEGMTEYPITISPLSMDVSSLLSPNKSTQEDTITKEEKEEQEAYKYPDTKEIYPYNPSDNPVELPINTNDMDVAEEFLIANIKPEWVSTIEYSRNLDFNIAYEKESGYGKMDTSKANWTEFFTNDEYADSQYDALIGSLPSNANEIALVVNRYNVISTNVLNELGITCERLEEESTVYNPIPFDEIMSSNLYLMYNDAYYSPNEEGTVFSARKNYEAVVEENVADSNKILPLKIVGILRLKKGASSNFVGSGVVYTDDLTTLLYDNCAQSQVVKAQMKNKEVNALTGDEFAVINYITILEKMVGKEYTDLIRKVLSAMNINYNTRQMYLSQLQSLGGLRTPSQIYIYPISFEAKELIIAALDEYNAEASESNQVNYLDSAGIFLGMVNQLIDIISYVLVAFSSVSLVVSSIMIGIITYVSVVERTKEIGVLRSLGARKLDISRVFNAETFIIGASSGIIGVSVTYVICAIVNAILYSLTEVANLAVLNPITALMLIAISITLTVLAGLIPAIFAAKKDPVVALRTE